MDCNRIFVTFRSMSEYLISIRNLVKTYPNGTQALKGVSFNVKHGEFVVVIGLSGSGKSTLLRCLNRLQDPTKGEIFFNGSDVAKANADQVKSIRTKIAMVFQQFNLIPRYSVLSNVLMGRLGQTGTWSSIFGLFSDEDRASAKSFIDLVGIGDKTNARVDQLSGGQQQRVAIARALAQKPSLLLADEPVASLDPSTSHVVMDYLKKANQDLGITIICNLHFLSLVREYATRVIALKAGEVVFDGKPEQITNEWFRKIYGEDARDVHVN